MKFIAFITDGKKYRFPPWLERAIMPAIAVGIFLFVEAIANADAMGSFGTYVYNGATGTLAKGTATVVLVLGAIALHKVEGRAHTTVGGAMTAAGGVLGAPTLATEAQHALGAFLIAAPQLLWGALNAAHTFFR